LKEKASAKNWIGIIVALIAITLLSYSPEHKDNEGYRWLILTFIIFLMWGTQAFVLKYSNQYMKAESIFFYMTLTGIFLSPIALCFTDFSIPINMGFKGPYLAAMIHVLNSIGALTIVYALRHGKAMIVVPMTGLSPVITVAISLVIYAVIPGLSLTFGIALAIVAIFLLSY